jgi:uncharacterized membrane protein YhaH (DUF805 family)
MNWYLKVLKQYFDFSGRARRKEYWMFTLFSVIVAFVLGIVDGATGATLGIEGLGLFGGLYVLAVLIPSIAVSVRRLHDIDRSGWWLLILLVPVIGAIVLLVWACSNGTQGNNRFGPDPKADEGGAVPAMA